jgi:hypothetical protein
MSDHTWVLVVDTDGGRAASLVELLAPAGYDTRHAPTAAEPGPVPDLVVLSTGGRSTASSRSTATTG